MARRSLGPRRTGSFRAYVRGTRIVGSVVVLVLFGAIAWDFANDGFWSRHTLLANLVASFIGDNLVAIAQLAESLDRGSFALALRIVPLDWWVSQLPDRPSPAENLRS